MICVVQSLDDVALQSGDHLRFACEFVIILASGSAFPRSRALIRWSLTSGYTFITDDATTLAVDTMLLMSENTSNHRRCAILLNAGFSSQVCAASVNLGGDFSCYEASLQLRFSGE